MDNSRALLVGVAFLVACPIAAGAYFRTDRAAPPPVPSSAPPPEPPRMASLWVDVTMAAFRRCLDEGRGGGLVAHQCRFSCGEHSKIGGGVEREVWFVDLPEAACEAAGAPSLEIFRP